MDGPGSVTVLVNQLRAGEARDEAVARLWERYFARLVDRARAHLRGRRALGDGEDAALSAFDGFVRAVEAGRFPDLDDRDDLWRVLLMLTVSRARDAARREGRDKRGGGLAAHGVAGADSDPGGVPVPSPDPGPAEAAALAEEAERLLAALPTDELRRVAVLALEGHTNAEIAAELGVAVVAVERKRRRIRDRWARAVPG